MYTDFSRNSMTLQDIVKGRYGRRIAYYNAETVTAENVLKILSATVGIFNTNRAVARYLWRYKNGDQPILYRVKKERADINNKVVENHALEIVLFSVAQTYGESLQYVSTKGDDRINKAVEEFNGFNKRAFKHQRNISQGEYKSTVGTSFLGLGKSGKEDRPYFVMVPTPMNTYVVYNEYTGEPLMSVQELKDDKDETYYHIFSSNMEFKVKNSKIAYKGLHAYGGIPIIEIPNNQDRLSDIEIVITLLDAINTMQSNRMDGIEQFIQAWIKFVNCEIDEETFHKMRDEGALVVKSNNGDGNKADVEMMTSSLDQTQAQVAKDDLWDNAQSILAVPTKQGNTGGDTQGAVQLRNGWDFAKSRAKLKDAYVIEGETRFAEVALKILKMTGHDLKITTADFDVNIPHSPQDNMTVKANVLKILLESHIHPLVAIKCCGLWNDAENTYMMSKPYLDVVYKTIDDAIAEIPDADEQIKKAQGIANEYSNSQARILDRLEKRLNGRAE